MLIRFVAMTNVDISTIKTTWHWILIRLCILERPWATQWSPSHLWIPCGLQLATMSPVHFLSSSPRWLSGKNSPANAGDTSLIPWSGRSPREGSGNPLQYSCLENQRTRSLAATVCGVAKEIRLSSNSFSQIFPSVPHLIPKSLFTSFLK